MKALLILGIVFALIVAGCAGSQSPPAQQNPPAATGQQQPAENNPPAPPAEQIGMPVPGEENVTETEVLPAQQVKEFTVEATLWQFTPSTITVNRGDTVKLTLKNVEGVHGIYIPDYNVSLKAGAGETNSTEFTADKAGTFPFRCNVMCGEGHTEMTGTLVVNE